MRPIHRAVLLPLLSLGVVALAACGGDGGGRLTIYSGRSEELVGPLLEEFSNETGIGIDVLYGDSADLARQIDEEGANTPADVFYSQAPGPLGYLDAADRFETLPAEILDLVPEAYRAADGDWVGVSARVRTVVYDPTQLSEDEIPSSVLDLVDPAYEGRVGLAPTNASFQDFVSYLRAALGDEETSAFLEGLAANGARTYPNNLAIVEAVGRGEIDFGLVNHYYALEASAQDASLDVANHFFPAGDPGSVVLVSGAGVLAGTGMSDEAQQFIAFLLSPEAQQYFAEETLEYPLVPGVEPVDGQPPLDQVAGVIADLGALGESFATTLELIEASGLTG
jgi:iron(III) transport system substrate-binding protein